MALSQQSKPKTLIPDLPNDTKLVDKDGNITDIWMLYFQQVNAALQTVIKSEGIAVPQLTTTLISSLASLTVGVFPSIGNIVYDSTINQFKGIVATGAPATWPPYRIPTQVKTFTIV